MKAVISDECPGKIAPDSKYPNMYRLQWKDGSLSGKYKEPGGPLEDGDPIGSYGMYNLTRARDILRNYDKYVDKMKLSQRSRGNSFRSGSKTVTGEFSDAEVVRSAGNKNSALRGSVAGLN